MSKRKPLKEKKNEIALKAIESFLIREKWFNFNPICIYGKPNIIKRHLLKIIEITLSNSGKKVLRLSAKKLTKDIIESISDNNIDDELTRTRNIYRKIDILIIEDVDCLAKGILYQEEMTNLLIQRIENRKCTIFSTHEHPTRLTHLEEYLASRIGCGLSIKTF